MKNLLVAISDVHISLKNLSVSLQVLRQALEKARDLKVPLFIAGDLNDTKAVMRSEWVQALIDLFSEFYDVQIEIIDGNHDLNNKAESKSSLSFLNLIQNVSVYHNPSHYGDWYLIPYCNTNEAFMEAISHARDTGKKRLICHQGFKGAFMGDYVVDDSSIDPDLLKDFEIILSGHYHRHQWVNDNIMYFGSPFTVNFGESGHDKFIWSIYEADGKIGCQPIPTQVRKHVQFTLEPGYETQEAPEVWMNKRPDDLFKIIMKGPKEFALSKPNFELTNVTLVPDIQRQSEIRISQEIANKPKEIIEEYLISATTEFDKENLRKQLYSVIGDLLNSLQSKVNKDFKVTSVIAENFLSYERLEYNYESKGLTLIEGHDEDHDISTGAGKSSFLDVVCYGLFGETSKSLKSDEVVNRKAGKGTEVHVQLKGPNGYVVVSRYRKHHTFGNDVFYTIDDEAHRGKDNRETQSEIEELIGIDFDMFLRSSYFTQFGSIDRFLSAPDSEKKRIIAQICDTQFCDDIVVLLKEENKKLTSDLMRIQTEFDRAESAYETTKKTISDLEINAEKWELKKSEDIENLKVQRGLWASEQTIKINRLKEQSESFESRKQLRIQDAEQDAKSWDIQEQGFIKQIQTNIDNKKKKVVELENKLVLCDAINFDQQRQEVQNKLNIVENLEKEIQNLDNEIFQKDKIIQEYGNKKLIAENINAESKCLTCYQPISKEHIDKHIKEIVLQIENTDREKKILQAKKTPIVESIKIKSELQKKLREIDADEFEYNHNVKQQKQNESDIQEIKVEILRLTEQLENRPTNPNLSLIESIKNEKDPYASQIAVISLEKDPYKERLEQLIESTNPFTDSIQSELKKLKETQEIKLQKSEAKRLINNQIEMCEWWKDAFHIYIKSYLTDSFLEKINQLANETLSQMFDGILSVHISATSSNKKTTKEKINVVIYNKNEECSYNSLSGGERCRICFALNLAISKVTNINFGFLMFDEVLNGLDDVGKNQVMRVFKELESQYETIFVIDHTTEFKSLFTNNILVRKSNGISRVVE